MYAGSQEIFTIHKNGNSVLAQVTASLTAAGLYVMESFDLQSAVDTHSSCGCDSSSCNCQMKILLVYGEEGPPATLLLDSEGGKTTLSLAPGLGAASRPEWVERLPEMLGPRSDMME